MLKTPLPRQTNPPTSLKRVQFYRDLLVIVKYEFSVAIIEKNNIIVEEALEPNLDFWFLGCHDKSAELLSFIAIQLRITKNEVKLSQGSGESIKGI